MLGVCHAFWYCIFYVGIIGCVVAFGVLLVLFQFQERPNFLVFGDSEGIVCANYQYYYPCKPRVLAVSIATKWGTTPAWPRADLILPCKTSHSSPKNCYKCLGAPIMVQLGDPCSPKNESPPPWERVCVVVLPPLRVGVAGWVCIPFPRTNGIIPLEGCFPLQREGPLQRTSLGVLTLHKNIVFVPQGR